MQKRQFLLPAAVVFGDLEMGVAAGRPVVGQPGQFEVVGREQRVGPVVPGQPLGDRARQRQTVVSGGPAADLVEQYQRAIGRVMQDLGGLAHLDHERRLAGGQVVAGADAREHAIQRADGRRIGRDVAADVRQQHDQRGLAHIGRLAAHVGAGDQQQAAVLVEVRVVGHEGLVGEALDDRMTAAGDGDARGVLQHRRDPAMIQRTAGQRAQYIDLGQRGRDRLQACQMACERVHEFAIERLFARQGAFPGRQNLILEALELRGDVALDGLERLSALVVGRRLVGMRSAHLDVVAVHPVVADLERVDAGPLALARFQFGKKAVGVGRQFPQLVEGRVEPRGEHAAVAHDHRGIVDDRALQQVGDRGHRVEPCVELCEQRGVEIGEMHLDPRQRGQRDRQSGQIARAGRAQRDAGRDPLHVRDLREHGVQRIVAARGKRVDGLMTVPERVEVAQRLGHPAPQGARAHGGRTAVEQADQAVAGVAGGAAIDLQIPARGAVEYQGVGDRIGPHGRDMRQRGLLRGLDIVEQGAGGGDRPRLVGTAESVQLGHVEEGGELAARGHRVEQPGRAFAHGRARRRVCQGAVLGDHDLAGGQPRQLGRQRGLVGDLRHGEVAAGELQHREADGAPGRGDRDHQIRTAGIQQRLVGDGAGRDDAHHLPTHRALARARRFELLADRHRLAPIEQTREILLGRVVGHAGHRNRGAGRFAACGQGDVQEIGGALRVVVEQLVEIAHAIEQQHVRIIGLDRQVLAHHRRMRGLGRVLGAGPGAALGHRRARGQAAWAAGRFGRSAERRL